jgi:hypothetical protein
MRANPPSSEMVPQYCGSRHADLCGQKLKGVADSNVDYARLPAEHGEGVMGGRSHG